MADELTFDDVLWHLQHNEYPAMRAEAAELLGRYVDDLNDEEYGRAAHALNEALSDRAVNVVMAAMEALAHYNRRARQQAEADSRRKPDDAPITAIALCLVCGKPEALADPSVCPHADCPYRRR